MKIKSDLKRSYYQYKRHIEVGYLKINFIQKLFLSVLFFLLLPFVLIDILYTNKLNKYKHKNFIIEYDTKDPLNTIYTALKNIKQLKFIKLPRFYIPIIPVIFLKDIWSEFKKEPLFIITNMPFFGALILRVSKYYFLVKHNSILNLTVFQEYSFYMSYFTRIMENRGGNLYNIMHGVPGATYSYFRFSKCFVWGEYYKKVYIENGADASQFIISGSLFHYAIKHQHKEIHKDKIDILYVMQGNIKHKEKEDVLDILDELSSKYVIRIKQHPRHRVSIKQNNLKEIDENIIDCILKSKIIIGHYSTALLDGVLLGKIVISYLNNNAKEKQCVEYLSKNNIIHTKESLIKLLNFEKDDVLNIIGLERKYIDIDKNPIKIIENEIYKNKCTIN